MQRCQRACGRYSAALSIRPRQASEMMSCTPLSPRSTRWRRNADQPDLSSLAPSQMPRISRKPSELTALATSSETLRTSPAQVRHDAVQIKIRMLAFDASVPPRFDLGVDLLVEVGHRARAHPRAPQSFSDVLHASHRDSRQIHLDQCLLHRALPAAVPLNDRSLEGLTPQLWNLEVYFAGAGLQRPIVAASTGVLPSLTAFVTAGTAQLVCLSIQHGVQRLFHRATNHLAKMVSDPGFIDLDHLTHRILVTHRLLLHSMKKPSLPKVRKIRHVIHTLLLSVAVERMIIERVMPAQAE